SSAEAKPGRNSSEVQTGEAGSGGAGGDDNDVDMIDAVGATQRNNAMTSLTPRASAVTPAIDSDQNAMDTSEPAPNPAHTSSESCASNNTSFSASGANYFVSNSVASDRGPNFNQLPSEVPTSSQPAGRSMLDNSEASAAAHIIPGMIQNDGQSGPQDQHPFDSTPPPSAPEQPSSSSNPSKSSSSNSVVRRPQDKRRSNGLTFGAPSRHTRKAALRPSPLKQSLNDSDDDIDFYVDDPDGKKPESPLYSFNKPGSLYDPDNPPYSPFKTSSSSSKPSVQSKVRSSWNGLENTYTSPSSSPAYTQVTGRNPIPGLGSQTSANKPPGPKLGVPSQGSPAYTPMTGGTSLPGLNNQGPPGPKPGVPFQGKPPFKGYGPNLPDWLRKATAGIGSPTTTGATPSKPPACTNGSPRSTGPTSSKPPASVPTFGKPKASPAATGSTASKPPASVPLVGKPKDDSEESEEE
ncbi:MAG: hypothetical protein Q9183_006041, partial [Haloplaca sp. 2 TL-2023]